jgi:hypothetical protein
MWKTCFIILVKVNNTRGKLSFQPLWTSASTRKHFPSISQLSTVILTRPRENHWQAHIPSCFWTSEEKWSRHWDDPSASRSPESLACRNYPAGARYTRVPFSTSQLLFHSLHHRLTLILPIAPLSTPGTTDRCTPPKILQTTHPNHRLKNNVVTNSTHPSPLLTIKLPAINQPPASSLTQSSPRPPIFHPAMVDGERARLRCSPRRPRQIKSEKKLGTLPNIARAHCSGIVEGEEEWQGWKERVNWSAYVMWGRELSARIEAGMLCAPTALLIMPKFIPSAEYVGFKEGFFHSSSTRS